ncbi:hypothetical protein G7Z17_g5840 [Cylindrodendrum hubeiense]|uniref:2-methylcitrate dehydratase n=1 Tax=Cylindrodendrum hubeiense TaxID=595255 RepID=A0A9P5LFS2_9HYPO|nr:hypothetical protein G7Z17_g5840 [Cylindrodendrum hubeiense]
MATGNAEYDAIIRDIVDYVYHGKITNKAVYKQARMALLDALGCAIETLHLSPECKALVGPIVPGTIVPGGVRIPGTGHIVDPLKGAFDLGALIRYLDHNDAYAGAEWGHPSDNLAAILSVTDWLSQKHGETGVSLRTVLTAQIKAYEIQGTLQQTNAFNAHGIDHVILVKVASTAVLVWLLDLPESAALAAVSHAWIDGHPLRTYRHEPNTGPRKGWAAGDACMRAVHLALVTKRAGQVDPETSAWSGGAAVGVPTAISARRWGFSDASYGGKAVTRAYNYGSRVMETILFKLITAEGHGISAVEAAVQVAEMLRARQLVADRDIRTIKIRTQKPAMTIINKTGPLWNNADRDHSLQYMVAVTLLKESVVDTADYLDDSPWATDSRVDALREKMVVTEDTAFTADYYNPDIRSVTNAISVELTNEEVLDEVVVEFPVGHHKRAMTLDGVMTKFRRNMSYMFSSEEVDRITQAIENDDMPVDEFMALFVRWSGTAHLPTIAAGSIVGYETGPRVGLGVYGIEVLSRGWHSGAIFGPAASAAAAAKLLQLPATAIEDAVGMACTQAGGLMSAQYESTVKRMQHGFAARNGLFAAFMARSGYAGIKQVLERPYGGFLSTFSLGNGRTPAYLPDRVVEGLNVRWELDQIVVKPYASMAATHSTIDGIIALQAKYPSQMAVVDQIRCITVEMSEPAFKKGGWSPTRPLTVTGAQMTATYAAAMQLLDGQVQPAQFAPAQLERDDVWALMARIHCVQNTSLETYQQRLRVELTGQAETLTEFVAAPRGNGKPLSNDDILDKWRRLTADVIDLERRDAIERIVLQLEMVQDMRQLVRLLSGRTGDIFGAEHKTML